LILLVFFKIPSVLAASQELTFPQESSIPEWVAPVFKQSGLSNRYVFSSRLNPFYQRGDFDGDGKLDIAIWIRELKSKIVLMSAVGLYATIMIDINTQGHRPIVQPGIGTYITAAIITLEIAAGILSRRTAVISHRRLAISKP